MDPPAGSEGVPNARSCSKRRARCSGANYGIKLRADASAAPPAPKMVELGPRADIGSRLGSGDQRWTWARVMMPSLNAVHLLPELHA